MDNVVTTEKQATAQSTKNFTERFASLQICKQTTTTITWFQ